jgi:ribonuclease-3
MTGPQTDAEAPSGRSAGLESVLGHVFSDSGLLVDALTHPSLAGLSRTNGAGDDRVPGQAYERLEFLGDRVLGLVVAEWLLERFPGEREGSLARRHAALVRREALAVVADSVDLGRSLRLSPGEQGCGGRANRTILADACEAVIGALYLDGGLDVARRFVRRAWGAQIDAAHAPPQDCKTALQEWVQGQGKPLPVYEIVRRSGPAHEPEFEVAVRVEGYPPVQGTGRSRRLAETTAARGMLRQLGYAVE